MSQWINFADLRKQLDFKKVLESYGCTLTIRGDQATCPCPLPNHGGDRKARSFSANLSKGIWQAFCCRVSGNVLDLACLIERRSPDNPKDVRTVALQLHEKFIAGDGAQAPAPKPESKRGRRRRPTRDTKQEPMTLVNQPLDFELKGLDPNHSWFKSRGLELGTIVRFGLGYCTRGLMAGRIAIPLHQEGQLIGYAGRLADDDTASMDNPRYLYPAPRERGGVCLVTDTRLFLYNGHQITTPAYDLLVVCDPESVWSLFQAGYPQVVALMQPTCSEEQASLIVEMTEADSAIWIMTGDDPAGEECAASIFRSVGTKRLVSWVKLSGVAPWELRQDELNDVLSML